MMNKTKAIINKLNIEEGLKIIAHKVIDSERIDIDEALFLYEEAELSFVAMLANIVRERINGDFTYFNRNIHIEPSNKCIFNCRFCSYSEFASGHGWEMSHDDIIDIVKSLDDSITEIHMVGSVHPERDIHFYEKIISDIKKISPKIHLKAFTAVELDYLFSKAELSNDDGFKLLKNSGLDSMPGGGAEIFDEDIRKQLCEKKSDSKKWLEIHKAAHKAGIHTNATMLYGHIENYSHRIDHLNRLRQLQDETSMFNVFIPLKFRNTNNELSGIKEISMTEDLKNYAVSRIFLDNFNHIKAYWPMIGKEIAQLSLSFGVDDLDGTINDSTKIYSMAGADDKNPAMTMKDMIMLIKDVNRTPVERDSLYNRLKEY